MGVVMDIGANSRHSAVAPIQLLLDVLRSSANAHDACKLSTLTNATDLGEMELFADFNGSPEQLIREFATTNILGLKIDVARYCFICVWPPKCFGSAMGVWRIIGETDKSWDETLLDQIIDFPGIEHAAISVDEAMDLENLDHVNCENFPWGHWRLIAARTNS